jgi:hypothetical protein
MCLLRVFRSLTRSGHRTCADAAITLGHDAWAVLGVRPNLVALAPAGTPGSTAVELYSDEPFGKYAIATARLGDVLIKAKSARSAPARIGATSSWSECVTRRSAISRA